MTSKALIQKNKHPLIGRIGGAEPLNSALLSSIGEFMTSKCVYPLGLSIALTCHKSKMVQYSTHDNMTIFQGNNLAHHGKENIGKWS